MPSHRQVIAASLLPQAVPGSTVRARHLDGSRCRQYFTAGGFFATSSSKMRQADLVKAAALTVDVDAYDWKGAAIWGEDRDERKQAMRNASAEDVLGWMKEVRFVETVLEQAGFEGLPRPNRILYTGQGINLVYWIEDAIGWTSGDGWTADRMKATVKRFHAARPDLWWWDSSAKDIGTRIFPLPTLPHRDTGKIVRVLDSHDNIVPLAPWFDKLEAAYPVPKKIKKAPTTARKRSRSKCGPAPSGSTWTTVIHDPGLHPDFDIGGRGVCPVCDGSGYRRLDAEHYSCFSCRTHFRVVPVEARPEAPSEGATKIPLDEHGRAKWPDVVPTHLVNKGKTGAGKTFLMRQVRDDWSTGPHRRVVAVAPTLALAGGLASRLDLQHADARNNRTWKNGSLVTCFAGLVAKTAGLNDGALAGTCLLVDEVESCLLQLYGMLSGDRAREAYNVLLHLVAGAGRVFLGDAHAGPVTRKMIEDVDVLRASRGLEPLDWTTWTTEKTRFAFSFVSPVTRKTKKGDEVLVRSSDAEHRGLIFERLQAGKRLAIYCPGRDAAIGLGRAIRKEFKSKKIAVVVGSTSREKEADLSVEGLTADVLIYNNAMSTGVSYDREHYDEVHLLLGRGTVADGISVEQAAHRIRKPKSKTITISGTVGAVVDDWRIDPEAHIARGVERFAATAVSVAKWSGLKLASDWFCSAESRRLGAIQATIIASRYARGYRWLVYYLAARHDFVETRGVENESFVDESRAARDQVKIEEAKAIAAAPAMSDTMADIIETRGADTEDEYHSFEARMVTRVLGDAFTDADEDERTELVLRTKHDQLATKARTFAAVWMLLQDDPDLRRQLAAAEVARNRESTVIAEKLTIPEASVVLEVLKQLGQAGEEDGRLYCDRETASRIVGHCQPIAERYGVKMRRNGTRRPIQQVNAWLSTAGLRLRSVREHRGARRYFLAKSDFDYMSRLSGAYVERWTTKDNKLLTA